MLSTELLEHQILDALPASIYVLDLDSRLTSVHQPPARAGDDSAASATSDANRGLAIWDVMRGVISRDQVEHATRELRAGRASVVRWELERTHDDRVSLAQMTPLHDDAHGVTGFVISTTDVTTLDRARDAVFASGLAISRAIDVDQAYHEATLELRRALRADMIVVAMLDDSNAAPQISYEYGSDSDRHVLQRRFAATWDSILHGERAVTSHADSTLTLTVAIETDTRKLGALTVVTDDIESPERIADATRFLKSIAAQLATAIERTHAIDHHARKHRSAAIGEVATGVANELRNPVFGISSAAQLLRFRASQDPVMEKNVGRILREVERLNRMVSTLLDLGRPIALKLSPSDPDAVWDDVLQSERGRLESRAVAVRRARSHSATNIEIDREQLSHAFRSILLNAVDAAPEASDITLHSSALPAGWRCRLTNGGAPISRELLPRVFEPFLSTKPGSTGVGLAIAERVIEQHGGTVAIESSAESGTTVSVTLPNTTRIASLP